MKTMHGLAAAAALLLGSSAAFAGPEVVAGPGADPECFAPWSAETTYLQWPAQEGPYRIAIVNGFVGNTWRIQMIKTAKAYAEDPAVKEQIEIQLKYAGYIDRQAKEVERHDHYENLKLPENLNYLDIAALSFEVRQKLDKQRPETLGQASRISGVTPAAISLLLVHLKKRGARGFTSNATVEAAE